MRTLRFPRGSTHLHERDFTEAERLVFHEYNRLFPDRASMTDDAIRANLPLLTAMQRIFLMRSFDVFGGIFVPTWLGLLGDPEGKYEGLFWHYFTHDFDATSRALAFHIEEMRHLDEVFGAPLFDDAQPEIPDDDPRWQQHEAHMASFRAQYDARHTKRSEA